MAHEASYKNNKKLKFVICATMDQIVNSIIKYFPNHWDKSINHQKPYSEINVSNNEEFDKISDLLREAAKEYYHKQLKIRRVQNVFAYGQFIVREQYLINENPSTYYRVQCFYVVRKSYLNNAIEYNLDPRRIGIGTTTLTFSSKLNIVPIDHVALLVWVLTCNPNEDSFTPKRSSDYYIEYIVDFD